MTVVARRFVASPTRTATEAWQAISDLICESNETAAKEFKKINGVASLLIAEEILKDHPLVMRGSGPRLKVYCLYDEDAVDAEDQNEDRLSWEPTENDWEVLLPCSSDDVEWITKKLTKESTKFSVYDIAKGIDENNSQKSDSISLSIIVKEFKKL